MAQQSRWEIWKDFKVLIIKKILAFGLLWLALSASQAFAQTPPWSILGISQGTWDSGTFVPTTQQWTTLLGNTLAYNNLTVLKAVTLSGLPSGATIYRAGYANPGDGGGAMYTLSTSACPLASGAGDNGSQVKPTSGVGCWLIVPQVSGYDARIWGAVGDGSTDDHAAINAALASESTILIPSGKTFYLGSVGLTIANDGTQLICGDNKNAELTMSPNSTVAQIDITSKNNIVRNCNLNGSATAQTNFNFGIFIHDSSSHNKILYNTIYAQGDNAIYDMGSQDEIAGNTVKDTYANCISVNGWSVGTQVPNYYASQNNIHDNWIGPNCAKGQANPSYDAIDLDLSHNFAHVHHNIIVGSDITIYGSAVSTDGGLLSYGDTVDHNHITSSLAGGIQINGYVAREIIDGNDIDGATKQTGNPNSGHCVVIDTVTQVSVLNAVNDIQVDNNLCRLPQTDGIWFGDSGNSCLLGGPAMTFHTGSNLNIAVTNTCVAGNSVTLTGITPPAPFVFGTAYYVIATGLSGSQIQLSATNGGSAIQATSVGNSVVGAPASGPTGVQLNSNFIQNVAVGYAGIRGSSNSLNFTIQGNAIYPGSGGYAIDVGDITTGAGSITGNTVVLGSGVTFPIELNVASPSIVARNNPGFTYGGLGPPTVPASNVAYTNAYGVDALVCTIPVGGTTLTNVMIDTFSSSMTIKNCITIPAGHTITLVYTGTTPTWTWYGY